MTFCEGVKVTDPTAFPADNQDEVKAQYMRVSRYNNAMFWMSAAHCSRSSHCVFSRDRVSLRFMPRRLRHRVAACMRG
eukprot:43876-Eustigmatos_ZCMA.PRE.1